MIGERQCEGRAEELMGDWEANNRTRKGIMMRKRRGEGGWGAEGEEGKGKV